MDPTIFFSSTYTIFVVDVSWNFDELRLGRIEDPSSSGRPGVAFQALHTRYRLIGPPKLNPTKADNKILVLSEPHQPKLAYLSSSRLNNYVANATIPLHNILFFFLFLLHFVLRFLRGSPAEPSIDRQDGLIHNLYPANICQTLASPFPPRKPPTFHFYLQQQFHRR